MKGGNQNLSKEVYLIQYNYVKTYIGLFIYNECSGVVLILGAIVHGLPVYCLFVGT